MVAIYRQEIIQDIEYFTSQPQKRFYNELFLNLDLNYIKYDYAKTGRPKTDIHSLICGFIVMKCEGFERVTELWDYLNNNLIIAHYCGFNIMKPLPSYSVFRKFIKEFDNELLKALMQEQVLELCSLGIIDSSFIALDSTPVAANTSHNNSKSFKKDKFNKEKPPKSDKNCKLGVHSASNQHNEKKYAFYWGYKNHILIDTISGLPIYELTTTANVADSSVALDILKHTDEFLSLNETYFIADKGYDVKNIYNHVKDVLDGEAFISLNKRNSKPNRKA